MLPRRTLIVRPGHPGAALKRRANNVDALAGGMHRDRDADASRVRGQRVDLFPGLAFVGRLVESSAVRSLRLTTAKSATATKSAAQALRCREDHVRLVECILKVARAVGVRRF